MRVLFYFSAIYLLAAQLSVLSASDYSDQDGDGFIDSIELRYASGAAVDNPDLTPEHGLPIMVGQTIELDAVQRFPEFETAVAIDAGGFGEQQYVLILTGDGRVASWSLFGFESIEVKLYENNDWIGTHPRQWEGIVAIEVAPFGLFGIEGDGTVHMCGEPWAVSAVAGYGHLREIETSHDSLIVITAAGQVATATDGSWTAPAVPDLAEGAGFWGDPIRVAAGRRTFWVLGSKSGVKGWGDPDYLAQMDYRAFEASPLARVIVSPTHAAGLRISLADSAVAFGDDATQGSFDPSYGSFTPTPGEGNTFSSLGAEGYQTNATLDDLLPIAPSHWQFGQLTSSEVALFGILRHGTPLEWAVADASGASSPAALDEADWRNLLHLDMSNLPVASLEGLERARDLEQLDFEGTSVRDLSPLENLNDLRDIDTSRSPVLDLSPVAEHLFHISNFADTAAAEVERSLRTVLGFQLRRVYADVLARNQSDFSISYRSPVWWHQFDAGLAELIRLRIGSGHFDSAELSSVHVLDADLPEAEGLRLSNLRGIALLSGLRELTIPDQSVSDISGLANLPYLERIDLSNNPVADLSALLQLPSLQSVDISDTGAAEFLDSVWSDVPVRREIEAILAELNRRGVDIVNSGAHPRDDWQVHFEAQTAAALRAELGLQAPQLSLDDLEQVHNLQVNDDFQITDLSGLQYVWQIQAIDLSEQRVSDLSPVKDLPYLRRLYVTYVTNHDFDDSSQRVADLSPLAAHPSLQMIALDGSNVLDISPLLDLPRLDSLELNDTFFAELVQEGDAANPAVQSAQAAVSAFEASGVSVYLGGPQRDDWWRVFEPALGRALRDEFGGTIHLSDLENATSLQLVGRGIYDLSGMELCHRLQDLNLDHNLITNLSPLSRLQHLVSLDLGGNPVLNVQPLLGLDALEDVNLSDTSASELSWLHEPYSAAMEVYADFAALRGRGVSLQDSASIRSDWWRHMAPDLSAHVLVELGIGPYEVSMGDLMGVNHFASFSDHLRPINDLSGIQLMMDLNELTLPNQLITDLSPVSKLGYLQRLNLSNPDLEWPMNRVSDLTSLAGHRQLDYLDLSNNDVLELEPLGTLPQLTEVLIDGTFAAELIASAAQENPYAQRARAWADSFQGALQHTAYERNDWWRVFDPALGGELVEAQGTAGKLALAFLEGLSSFSAPEKGIESIERIGLLHSLETLHLGSNPITDLSPLVELKALEDLSLDWVGAFAGSVPDITPLAAMRNLRHLDLSDNPLLQVEPLLDLPFLESVYLQNTFVEDQSENPSAWIVATLENRGVAVGLDTQERADWSWLFDYRLAAAINAEFGQPAGAGFSRADLLQLTQLDASEAGIESIKGLELAENLEDLNLANNAITDLAPLRSLTKLQDLNLGTDVDTYPLGNLYRDLGPIENLWSLQNLDLSGAAVTNFDLLARLPSLVNVNVGDTVFDAHSDLGDRLAVLGITLSTGGAVDASRILAPSLYRAIVRENGSVDLNDSHLYLEEQDVASLEGIGVFRGLEHLVLRHNLITDLSPLEGLPELREIDISNHYYDPYFGGAYGNAVRDISVLDSLPKLENFEAEGNLISDISPLLECESLQQVELRDNFIFDRGVSEISPDADILRRLEGRGIFVDAWTDRQDWYRLFPDPALAQYFANYRDYDFDGLGHLILDAPVRDLTGLEKCYQLTELILRNAEVQDLSPLTGLSRLERLSLDRENLGDQGLLKDLSPLSGHTGLVELSVRNQGLRDISVLSQIPRLSQADLSGNALDLRPGSAASNLIASLGGRVAFVLGDQRDFWSTVADAGLERAIRAQLGLNPDETITEQNWEQLTGLDASGFGIAAIDELALARNLEDVVLADNSIADVSALRGLEHLQSVDVSNSEGSQRVGNQIDDLSIFDDSSDLRELHLANSQVADLTPLLGMRKLDHIHLDGNPLDLKEDSETVRLLTVLQERGTTVTYDDRYRAGIDAVRADPQAFSLFTENQLRGLALGKPLLELNTEGEFQLKLDVYESSDLVDWLPGQGSFEELDGQLIWRPANPGNTRFYTIEAQ